MAKKHSPKFVELVDEAKSRIREITPQELRERAQTHPDLHVVDVREEHEYESAHLKGARHLSKGVLERDIEQSIPETEDEIILYCGGGYRSALAADNLQKMGYTNVASLAGGFRALKKEGFEMEGRDISR